MKAPLSHRIRMSDLCQHLHEDVIVERGDSKAFVIFRQIFSHLRFILNEREFTNKPVMQSELFPEIGLILALSDDLQDFLSADPI
jgi:hypothetical protein